MIPSIRHPPHPKPMMCDSHSPVPPPRMMDKKANRKLAEKAAKQENRAKRAAEAVVLTEEEKLKLREKQEVCLLALASYP